MKYLAITSVLLLLSAPALADQPVVAEKIKLAKTTSQQRALTEILSARIRAALEGEPYALVTSCKGKDCEVSSAGE